MRFRKYIVFFISLFCIPVLLALAVTFCSSESSPSQDTGFTEDVNTSLLAATVEDIGSFKSRLTRYPYITYRGNNSFSLFWETDKEEAGYIELDRKIYKTTPQRLTIKVGAEQRSRTIYQYRTTLDYLNKEKTYEYKILSLKAPFSGSFHSPSIDNNFIFAVYGDNRSGAPYLDENPTHKEVTSTIAKYKPEFVINTGDIVYAGGLESEWYQFFNDSALLFKNTPLFVAIGNHEKGGEDIFRRQFDFPNGDEFYYSFDWGKSHFIILCSDCGFKEGSVQYNWFVSDLSKAEGDANIKYIFVAFHHPPYTFSSHSPDSDARKYIVPKLKNGKTKMVFNGHNHLYEHMYKDGIHYLVSGGGGAPLYPEGEIKYEGGEEPYMVKYQIVFNFSIIYVSENEINVKSFDNNNQLIEGFIIK